MRISGRRRDGALYLSMGAGVAIILRGDRQSPPLDESAMDALGPWVVSADDNTESAKAAIERRLNHASVTTNVISLGLMSFEDKKDDKVPVSDIAAHADKKGAPPKEEVINLPPTAAAVVDPVADTATVAVAPNPVVPVDERKKKRGELKDKIRKHATSKNRVADVLEDDGINDDDLYEMAKSLGITDAEHPGAVKLTNFAALPASCKGK